MKTMNRTLLLSLLSRCKQILDDTGTNISERQFSGTVSNTTVSSLSNIGPATTVSTTSSRETYDNAHFYILFVMFFYSFLAMTLFKCFIDSDEEKKDPYEEFIKTGRPSTQAFNADHMAEKFYFEEENSLWATGFLRRRRRRGMNAYGGCFDSHQARKTSGQTTQARPASDFEKPVVDSFPPFHLTIRSLMQAGCSTGRRRRLPLMIWEMGGNIEKCGSMAGRNLLLWGPIRITNSRAFNMGTPQGTWDSQQTEGGAGQRLSECVCVIKMCVLTSHWIICKFRLNFLQHYFYLSNKNTTKTLNPVRANR